MPSHELRTLYGWTDLFEATKALYGFELSIEEFEDSKDNKTEEELA